MTTPTTSPSITLPQVPKGKELEDFIAASLQSSGHFVEKNIEDTNVLELDVVATSYQDAQPHPTVYEVKSGAWGPKDILKLLGQMTHLHIDHGVFVSGSEGDKPAEFYNEKFAPDGITVRVLDDLAVPPVFTDKTVLPLVHTVWRYSFWVERILVNRLVAASKSSPCSQGPKSAREYYELINNGVFFTPGGCDAVNPLYEAFKEHPTLTLEIAEELAHATYDPLHELGRLRLKEALHKGSDPILHISMYLEHRARLSILKGAVDELCRHGTASVLNAMWKGLPSSFVQALDEISGMPKFWLYPVFWQTLLWGWGGFILSELWDEELSTIAGEAGLTREEGEQALTVFDRLFPQGSGGWVTEMPTASYHLVKLTPWPFMGIGAFRRLKLYGWDDYSAAPGAGYTSSDMSRWNNHTYQLLLKG